MTPLAVVRFTTLVVIAGLSLPHAAFAAPAVPQSPEERGAASLRQEADAAKAEAIQAVAAIVAVPDDRRSFENTVLAVDDLHARLDESIGMLLFMAYVHPDPTMRDAICKVQSARGGGARARTRTRVQSAQPSAAT